MSELDSLSHNCVTCGKHLEAYEYHNSTHCIAELKSRAERAEAELAQLHEERRWIPFPRVIKRDEIELPCEVLFDMEGHMTHWRPFLETKEGEE